MLQTFEQLLAPLGFSVRALGVLLLAAAVGFLAAAVALFAVRRLAGGNQARLAATMARRCAGPLRALMPVIAMAITAPGVELAGSAASLAPRALSVAAIGLAGWFVIGMIRGLVDHVVATHSIEHADNLAERQVQTQIRLLGRVLIFAVTIATVAGALLVIPSIRNIGVSLFASAGIAGLAVGLAARPALANLVAGVQIALTQPIRLEDAVVVEGEWGWIEEINLTFVVIRVWDLRRLVLPISYFIEKPFQNWTRSTADILGSVMLHMDYSVPVDEVRAEFGRALRASRYWDGKVEVVHVTECLERTMQLRLLMSAGNSPDAWELRCEIRERLIAYLQQNFPHSLPRIRIEDDGNAREGQGLSNPSG
jgi:small-conductance mechanosensitive channel